LKAVSNFRILTQDQPQNPENWLLLARAHQISKEKQLAKEAAKKAVELKLSYLEARSFLYGLYIQDKDYDGAIRLIKDYLAVNDKDLANWGALGDIYVLMSDDKNARAAYQKMIDLEPQNPGGYVKLAVLSRKNKQPEEAARYLNAALQQNPNYYPALQLLVALYYEQKQPAKALDAARAAALRAPKNAPMQQILGEVYLSQNQPDAAVAPLEAAMTLDPNDVKALALLVRAYNAMPDKTKLLAELQKKAQDPQAPAFYALTLAQIYEQQRQGDKAIAVYKTLLARPLPPMVVKNNLAYLMAQYEPTPENLAQAQKMVADVLADHPEDPRLLDTTGWIYCRQKNYTEAQKYLEKAVAKAPNHPVLGYHLGYCAAQAGDKALARTALEKSLAFKGDFPEREEAQKLLDSLPASGK
jgi:tetratricopeptide (TPR) repeat protein